MVVQLFIMAHTMQLVGLAVTLLLTVGCNGAPNRVALRSGLVDPHIVMGRDVDIEQFPYMVSMEVFRMHGCGAVIVSENYALTAAHCVDPMVTGPTWYKRLRVGSTTSIPIIGWGGQIHQVAEVNHHPQWSMSTIDYDVGVIKVSSPFSWDARVRPISIATDSEDRFLDFSKTATVSGWGLTSPGGWFPAWHLKSVDIPLVQRQKCASIHQESSEAPKVTSRMLCAAGTGLGGPCQGDSGGALVHKGEVIGLVSWAMNCNDATYPSVFTNVMNKEIRSFIKQNTGL